MYKPKPIRYAEKAKRFAHVSSELISHRPERHGQLRSRNLKRHNGGHMTATETSHAFVPIAPQEREVKMRTPVMEESTHEDKWGQSPPNMEIMVHLANSGAEAGAAAAHFQSLERPPSSGLVRHRQQHRKDSADEGKHGCKCKKTACLKLYCRCFSLNLCCNAVCGCGSQCKNTNEFDPRRLQAIQSIRNRDSSAFNSKLRRGCRCVNSHCLKKYCVCFRAQTTCATDLCQCVGCKNTSSSMGHPPSAGELLDRGSKRLSSGVITSQPLMYQRVYKHTLQKHKLASSAQHHKVAKRPKLLGAMT